MKMTRRGWIKPKLGGYQAVDAGPMPATPPPGPGGASQLPIRVQLEQEVLVADARHAMAVEFQRRLGRKIPDAPTTDGFRDDEHRAHCAAIVLEEAFEFVAALGCRVHTKGSREVLDGHAIEVSVDAKRDGFDIVDAAHELGDVAYASETVSISLGVNLSDVFAELHLSNLTKITEDGKLLRHPVKNGYEQYRPPNIAAAIGLDSPGRVPPGSA